MDPLGAFETFLIWATGLLALAAVVVPFRYVWPCVASFAMFVAMFFEWPFEHDTRGSSPFSGTGEAIATLVFMLMAAPIALKLMACFVVLWRRRAQAGQARMPSPAHSVAGGERLLMGIAITGTGAVAGVLLVSTFAEHMAGQYPSLVVHMAGIAFVLALWALTPWCSRHLRLEGRFARLAAGLRWSVVATSLVAAAFIAFSIDRVVDRAEAAAGDAPYCMWVATPSGFYRPAATLLDLSPLTMRAQCDNFACESTHAHMAVANATGPTVLGWAYREQDFYRDPPPERFNPACGLRPHFARALPLF
jgi:hypothetical protein